jgi:CDP-L-myo-inositol myo-inositolphosphotransferase
MGYGLGTVNANRQEKEKTRKAVVLAAGAGTRLRKSRGLSPKPLLKILGVSLLERQLRGLAELEGMEEVIVVVGSQGEVLCDWLNQSGPWPFELRCVENPDWEKGNGTSLYAARAFLEGENFYVLVADHVFEPGTLEEFAAKVGGGPALSVANGQRQTLDLEDATKVEIDSEGLIQGISKDLVDFDAIDMGLFQLDGRIFHALEQAFRNGEYSLTAGVQLLLAKTPLRAVPSSFVWFDIDTETDFRHAERFLLNQIPSERDGLIARHLNRRLSLRLSGKLANWGVTPVQVTLFAFFMSLLSGLLFALGSPLAGGLMAQAGSVVDGMDGEIARMRGLTSRFGAFTDSLLDRLGDGAILVGLGLYAMSESPGPFALVLTGLALLVSPLSMEVKDRFFVVYGRQYVPKDEDCWTQFLLANHDGRMFLICLGGIFALPLVTLGLLVGLGLLQAAYRVWRVRYLEGPGRVGSREEEPTRKKQKVS